MTLRFRNRVTSMGMSTLAPQPTRIAHPSSLIGHNFRRARASRVIVFLFLITSCQTGPRRIETIQRLTLDDENYVSEIRNKHKQLKLDIPDKTLGYMLYDPNTQQILESKNEKAAFVPASTTKILTSIAALKILGPQFRFKTQVFYTGKIRKNILHGDLYLKGGGDPSLFVSHLMSLVRSLSDHGINQVDGNFYYDESEVIPQSMIREVGDSSAPYNPGLGAISVDFNQWVVQWHPNQKSQATLDVTVTPDFPLIHVSLANDKNSSQQAFVFEKNETTDKWLISPSLTSAGQQRLPVRHPSLLAAMLFSKLCKMNGIVLLTPQSKIVPPKASLLATHQSAPLVDIVERVLEYSNNMMAELILLAAAHKVAGKPVTIEQAAHIMKQWMLKEIKTSEWDSLQLVNGSGLTTVNLITPSQMISVLNYVDRFEFEDRSYESMLPISGWKGTLAHRLGPPEVAFRVWAKTGTMFYSSALAGYLYTLSGKRLIFAVMLSDPQGRAIVDSYKDDLPSKIEEQADSWNKTAWQVQDSLLQNWILKH